MTASTYRRIPNWPRALNEFIASRATTPFKWGENDCCLFASDGVLALTGIDPAASFRGRYDSALSAFRVLKESGGVAGIAEAQTGAHGWPEIPVAFAGRGDLVMTDFGTGDAMGICTGQKSAFVAEVSIEMVDTLKCRRAWRIG